MQANEQESQTQNDAELRAYAEGKAEAPSKSKSKSKSSKIAKVEGMAGGLAAKTTAAQNAAIATADRDALVFAQNYLQRFDANMGAINGKLTNAWQTVGNFDELGEGEELPPFEDQLENLLAG